MSESETVRILELLQSGYACVMFYNVAYMGFSKELVRKIGFWDSRFLFGGFGLSLLLIITLMELKSSFLMICLRYSVVIMVIIV